MDGQTAISLQDVNLSFPDAADSRLFEKFSLTFPLARITVLMGGSGSGKTTLARIASGRVAPTAGLISRHRDFSVPHDCVYVDQDAWNSVFPYRTVHQNLSWTLSRLGWPKSAAEERIGQLLAAFDLVAKRDAFPKFLSGGQRQRLALLRCLIWQPKCMIMDETLSALDEATKSKVIAVLIDEVRHRNMTLIHVTHNPVEALEIADRVLVIGGRPARIQGEVDCGFQGIGREETPALQSAQNQLMHLLRTTF
jgi:NitT/TauT family transport system ATP-binding protein